MQVLTDATTGALLGPAFACRPRETCSLKGFGELRVHELLGLGAA